MSNDHNFPVVYSFQSQKAISYLIVCKSHYMLSLVFSYSRTPLYKSLVTWERLLPQTLREVSSNITLTDLTRNLLTFLTSCKLTKWTNREVPSEFWILKHVSPAPFSKSKQHCWPLAGIPSPLKHQLLQAPYCCCSKSSLGKTLRVWVTVYREEDAIATFWSCKED